MPIPPLAELKIYPNPTTGILKLVPGAIPWDHVAIYDALGKKLTQISGAPATLNLSGFPTGGYWLVVDLVGGERVVKDVVKW